MEGQESYKNVLMAIKSHLSTVNKLICISDLSVVNVFLVRLKFENLKKM